MNSFRNLIIPEHIKGILLDLDNTCYAYNECHEQALIAAQKKSEELVGELVDFAARYKKSQLKVKSQIPTQAASHSRLLYFQELLDSLDYKESIPGSIALEDIYWGTFFKHMVPADGLFDFLSAVKARGIRIVFLTDLTTRLQFEKLIHLDLTTYADGVITSESAGVEKPDHKIFELGLQKLNTIAAETIMIGDDYQKDIIGARALGIATIHITE